MYKDNFVVVVKHNGSILREDNGVIRIPFGSEYTILFKNLESRKANVLISIDGKDILNESALVIPPNSETELRGELEGDSVKNKFKFIQKTDEISKYRGDKADDGLIRVEFAFEKSAITWITSWPQYTITYTSEPENPWWHYGTNVCGDTQITLCNSFYAQSSLENSDFNDDGITVKGSETLQEFMETTIGALDTSSVIVLQLKGIKENGTKIEKIMTVKDKLTCPTCGRTSKSDAKYCYNCGTHF